MTSSATVPAPRMSQAERRDASERQLIEATMAVVARHGVTAATFEAIGQEAGYSRGLAAQKFGSKNGLIDAVIASLHRKREEIIAADRVDAMPAMQAIGHFIERLLRELAHDNGGRAYFMLLASAVADATAAREAFADSNERVRAWLEGVIRRGQEAGEIRAAIDPATAALMIGSLLLGLGMQWLVNPATDIDDVGRAAMATIRRNFSTAETDR